MGEAEISGSQLIIHSHIIIYGNAATGSLTESIRAEIETMWNEPGAVISVKGDPFRVTFHITGHYEPGISVLDIISNTDPRNNYFRVEEFVQGNISFVDGVGSNSGYFKLENLYSGSTTAAHEYGHGLGLDHPADLNLLGKGAPGIMFPRGTLVDPEYQYDPSRAPGTPGGTMHPRFRRVRASDIMDIGLSRLDFKKGFARVGDFSNVWHPDHASPGPPGDPTV